MRRYSTEIESKDGLLMSLRRSHGERFDVDTMLCPEAHCAEMELDFNYHKNGGNGVLPSPTA
jgi:hypothetical protein